MNVTKRTITNLLKRNKIPVSHSTTTSVRGYHQRNAGFQVFEPLENKEPYVKVPDTVELRWVNTDTAHLHYSSSELEAQEMQQVTAAVAVLKGANLSVLVELSNSKFVATKSRSIKVTR